MARNAIQFIDEHGGPAAIARATGYAAGAVHLWRHRNKVPRTAWPEILEAFPNVSIADLKAVEAESAKAKSEATDEAA